MLEVLDTAGQEEYTALRDQWIRDGEGFILVYSISSRSSFTRIQKFHNQIQRVKESAAAGSPTYPGSPLSQTASGGLGGATAHSGPVPVMLVGNKCDKIADREVSTQEGSALAKQLNCEFVEASAKNCVNVEKAFYDVVRQLRRQRASAAPNKANGKAGYDTGPQDAHPNGFDYYPEKKNRYRRSDRKKKRGMCVIL